MKAKYPLMKLKESKILSLTILVATRIWQLGWGPRWRGFSFCSGWQCWRWSAGQRERCPLKSWTKTCEWEVMVENKKDPTCILDCKCLAGWTNHTRNRWWNRPGPNFLQDGEYLPTFHFILLEISPVSYIASKQRWPFLALPECPETFWGGCERK